MGWIDANALLIAAGAGGSLLGLVVFPVPDAARALRRSAAAFAMSVMLAPLAIEYFEIVSTAARSGVACLIGLAGIQLLRYRTKAEPKS